MTASDIISRPRLESRREMMRPDETPLAAFHRLNHDYIFPRVAGML